VKIIAKTKLQIKDQGELLNQIAGTYKDFFRAAMEYIDNAVDAAAGLQQSGKKFSAKIYIEVDSDKKTVSFTDNCEGMSPQELCELLSNVGRSKKKTVSWANGQFGFGVHAFRAFAREATFVSRKKNCEEAMIKIDRTVHESEEVPCVSTDGKQIEDPGTRVIISRFDPHVFQKSTFVKALAAEVEHHFDDVLRSKLVHIFISEKGKKPYECCHFDFTSLPGPALKKTFPLESNGKRSNIEVDLKVLDRAQDNRSAVLTNKRRRIQAIADLKSYKNFLRTKGEVSYLWNNPFVVGYIEIDDFCSPNLTRDDLKDLKEREQLYEKMCEVQKELKDLIDETMDKKTKESFRKIGSIMSDCLAQILKNFKLEFEQLVPSGIAGSFGEHIEEGEGKVPFGGDDEPGGGGLGPNEKGSGGRQSEQGRSGVGKDEKGGGIDEINKTSGQGGTSTEKIIQSPGPRIEFQNHAGEDRVIDLGNSLIVNTQHPDFISRNPSATGKIRFDVRLLNYVSQVVAPYCVHRLFERKGKVPSVSEVGANVVNLSLRLEQGLIKTVLGEEIETGFHA
jgi:hypothetical protein